MPSGLWAAPSKDNPSFDRCVMYDIIIIIFPIDDRSSSAGCVVTPQGGKTARENYRGASRKSVLVKKRQEQLKILFFVVVRCCHHQQDEPRDFAQSFPGSNRRVSLTAVPYQVADSLWASSTMTRSHRLTEKPRGMMRCPAKSRGIGKRAVTRSIERQYHPAADISVPQVGQDRVDVVEPLALDMGADLALRGEV
ncbi:hypothetical protein QFZ96_000801 [Paraburkholderia youngii]